MTGRDGSATEQEKALPRVTNGFPSPLQWHGLGPAMMCHRNCQFRVSQFLGGYLPKTPSYFIAFPVQFASRLQIPPECLHPFLREGGCYREPNPRAITIPRSPSPGKMSTSTPRPYLIKILTGYTSSPSIN